MFTAMVSIAGLICSVSASWAVGSSPVAGTWARSSSGMGWGITFCIMQAIAVALGLLGMAPDDILSHHPERRAHRLRLGSFARDITWARIESYMRFGDELATRTFRPDCGACDKYDACARRITRDEDLSRIGRLGRKLRGRVHELRIALHRPTAVCVMLLLLPACSPCSGSNPLQP